jgi:hypothetical protein
MSCYSFHSTRFILRIVACVFEFIALGIAVAVNEYTAFAYTGVIEIPCVSIPIISYPKGVLLMSSRLGLR